MLQLCMQTVAAALIRREGKILIAQRNGARPHPLEWEFPGGKVEPGETPEEALVRELKEELGIEAVVGSEFARYEYSYQDKDAIILVFFEVLRYSGPLENRGMFEQLVWESPGNFGRYPFLAGDLPLIQLLGKVHINQI